MASWGDGPGLAGRTAVVTGGSRGIGLAVAAKLAGEGARVAVVARNRGALEKAAAGIGAYAMTADVSREADVKALTGRVRDTFGQDTPDILVNAAGVFTLAAIAETEPADFAAHVAVNLVGPFLLMRAFLPGMLTRGSGHIVTIGSVAGYQAFPANGAYSASKFGVRGLHAVLDLELKGTGVRSTLVEPSATDTDIWESVDRQVHAGLPERSEMLSADAVADAVLFALTRPESAAVRRMALERA